MRKNCTATVIISVFESVLTLHAELSAELFDEGGPTNTLTGRE